jgi:hypothetical protein
LQRFLIFTGEKIKFTGENFVFTSEKIKFTGENFVFTSEKIILQAKLMKLPAKSKLP